MQSILDRLEQDKDAALERLIALLKIPSISTDPAYHDRCLQAAQWLCADLAGMGFSAEVMPTTGKPMVVADYRPKSGGPQLLFYGHYDVQPADPLDLWDSPPFQPQLREITPERRQIVARGAGDDKGQLMTFIEACRAWFAETGGLPVGVTILLEGEEESGSASLEPFLDAHANRLKADIALVCDTTMWDRDTPAITVQLRGLVGEEIIVSAADRDLHSGMYGNAARNPNHVLGRIIADLFDDQGRIQIPGFYDDVVAPDAAIVQQWRSLIPDDRALLRAVGLEQPAGEAGLSVLEQVWARPSAEVNGLIGGYTGEGFKTVIPAEARAKISFRLVRAQDPAAVRAAFRDFVRARIPADCSVTFREHGASPALAVDMTNPFVGLAQQELEAVFGTPAVLLGGGGSIPVVGAFKRKLGMDTLLAGFGLDDDRIHSPNEKYDLSSFERGARFWARLLQAAANQASVKKA